MSFVRCENCMLPSRCHYDDDQILSLVCKYNYKRREVWPPEGIIYGCMAGVSYKEVEAEKEKHEDKIKLDFEKELQMAKRSVKDLDCALLKAKATRKKAKTDIEAMNRMPPKPHPVPSMTTFLCESCLKAVQVPSDMIGQELRFKCFVCHQENYYDLTD